MSLAIKRHAITMSLLFLIGSLGACSSADAGAVYDGSMGTQGQLTGNFIVPAASGQIQGSNLFHSFSSFDVLTGESASFTGAATMQNIIARVSGGAVSTIDGLIDTATSMPQASFYFLNPAGVIFNNNASLNIGKSMYVSTADYLRMADNQQFFSTPQAGELLSTTAPTSFGFLAANAGAIQLNGAKLSVPALETFSLSAVDIQMNNASITSSAGHIDIASVASAGEVTSGAASLDVSTFSQMGDVNMSSSSLSTSGAGGGSIYIRAGQFLVNNSDLFTETNGVSAGGNMSIDVENAIFTNGSGLFGINSGTARGTDIQITASQSISFGGISPGTAPQTDLSQSGIYISAKNNTANGGNAGNLQLTAADITFEKGARIEANSLGAGNGGNVDLVASNTINFTGPNSWVEIGPQSSLFSGKTGISSFTAANINFTNGATIRAASKGLGHAGDVFLNATQKITFSGQSSEYDASGITTGTFGTVANTGNGGIISIQTVDLDLIDGAYFKADSIGSGDAGDVRIIVTGRVTVQGTNGFGSPSLIGSSTEPSTVGIPGGSAGRVQISAAELYVLDGARIVSSALSSNGESAGSAGLVDLNISGLMRVSGSNRYGEYDDTFGSAIYSRTISSGGTIAGAGHIQITAGSLELLTGGLISTSTNTVVQAGNISISSPSISIQGSASISGLLPSPDLTGLSTQPSFVPAAPTGNQASGIYAQSTHATSGGNSGNITIAASDLLMDGGVISSSSTNTGTAGDITITAARVMMDTAASMSSSSWYIGSSAGDAGWITLTLSDELRMQGGSNISTEAISSGGGEVTLNAINIIRMEQSNISSNVAFGVGNGGDIEIDPRFVILNNSNISANAFAGVGGNINIVADNFVQSIDSTVSASSLFGLSGNVSIDSPEVDVAHGLSNLPAQFLDAGKWAHKPCRARGQSSLIIQSRDGAGYILDDWQASPIIFPKEGSSIPSLESTWRDMQHHGVAWCG